MVIIINFRSLICEDLSNSNPSANFRFLKTFLPLNLIKLTELARHASERLLYNLQEFFQASDTLIELAGDGCLVD